VLVTIGTDCPAHEICQPRLGIVDALSEAAIGYIHLPQPPQYLRSAVIEVVGYVLTPFLYCALHVRVSRISIHEADKLIEDLFLSLGYPSPITFSVLRHGPVYGLDQLIQAFSLFDKELPVLFQCSYVIKARAVQVTNDPLPTVAVKSLAYQSADGSQAALHHQARDMRLGVRR